MSNYIRSAATPGQTRRIGPQPVGAFIGATMQAADYTAIASSRAAAVLALPFMTDAVVTTDADGKNPIATPYADQSTASDAYDRLVAAPGPKAYIGLFRKEADGSVSIIDETFLTAFQASSMFSKALPWLLVGVVVVTGVYFLNKKPTGRARARARVRGAIARARRRRR